MPTKKVYINAELEWAEQQLQSWKSYIDSNPIHELTERVVYKPSAKGGQMPVVAETVGQQIKTITELMAKYLSLLAVVNDLREKEEQKKIQSRGNLNLSPFETGDI